MVDWNSLIAIHFTCDKWLPTNHLLFQFANIFILMSFITFNHRFYLLYLKSVLCLSALCFCLWGWLVLCAFDTFLWNFVFTFINFFQLLYILYTSYPIDQKLDSKAELIYQKFGLENSVTRKTFYDIIIRNIWKIQTLNTGDVYSAEDMTETNKLSLLFSGKMAVIRDKVVITELSDLSFIDSAEWFVSTKKVETTPKYKVTLLANQNSILITWNSIQLRKALDSEPILSAIFNRIIGEDVIKTFYFN